MLPNPETRRAARNVRWKNAGPVGADLNDRNTDGVHQRHEEIVHFFGTTGACLVEVLNLVDDQHSERVQIGQLAHGCQQTFGTQLLASVATAVVGTQDLVYFVEEARAASSKSPSIGQSIFR